MLAVFIGDAHFPNNWKNGNPEQTRGDRCRQRSSGILESFSTRIQMNLLLLLTLASLQFILTSIYLELNVF